MDDSFELHIMSKQDPNNTFLKTEIQIVQYLQSLGLKMKTDPLLKQQSFHSKRKQQFNKSNTAQFEITSIKQLDLSSNSIKSRRTPSHTPQSSPMLVSQEQMLPTRKSIFSNKIDMFDEDDLADVQDYFTNM